MNVKICIKCKYLAFKLLTNNQFYFCLPSFWHDMKKLCNFKSSEINQFHSLLVILQFIVGPHYYLCGLLDDLDTLEINLLKRMSNSKF